MSATDIIDVPFALQRAMNFSFDIDWRGQPSQQSTGGVSKVIYNKFPKWVGSPKLRLDKGAIADWRAIRWSAQGRRHVFRLEVYDPIVDIDIDRHRFGIPFSTGQRFSTGYGFRYEPFWTAVAKARRGDTEMRVDVPVDGHPPVPGQHFSFDDWPYGIVEVEPILATRFRIRFQTALNTSISKGSFIKLRAQGLFRLVSDMSGAPIYERQRRATADLRVEQWIDR